MIRPQMYCDQDGTAIDDQTKALRVIQTDIYGVDKVLHFCNCKCLRAWIDEQMEDHDTVSVD